MGLLYLLRMHANELGQYALLDCDVNKKQKLYHSRLLSTMKTASCRQKKQYQISIISHNCNQQGRNFYLEANLLLVRDIGDKDVPCVCMMCIKSF